MHKTTRRIGASKLATVSEAQMPDGSLVAVKCFDRQHLSSFNHDLFFGAAKIWKSLSSPLLVRYIDVKPETHEIIQELWDRSVAVRLGEGNSDPKLVFHVLRDILKALAFLHELGYLHANLKPTNVFFSPLGQALLSDGLLVNIHSPHTLPSPINHKYMTPELTNDAHGTMSPSTDLYSAGFLALELLAGDRFGRAFQGVGDNTADDDIAWFQWHGSSLVAPDANSFAKSCPTELTRVIRKLVAKNPSDRYHSAQEALAELPDHWIVATQTSSPLEGKKLRRELLASHILERPTNGLVLVIASGPRAGEMIGTDLPRFSVGFSDDCFIRFQSDIPSETAARVDFSRGPDGWSVRSERDGRVYINECALSDERLLRSGDIIRLSANGPDLQFTLQSGGFDIAQLVKRFLPVTPAKNEVREPVRQQPASPSFPKGKSPHAASNERTPSNTQAAKSLLHAPWFQPKSWSPKSWSPKSWSKEQKNWAMLFSGLCLILLLLTITSSPSAPDPDNKNSKQTQPVPKSTSSPSEPAEPKNAESSEPINADAQSPSPKEASGSDPSAGIDVDDADQ